MKVNVKKLKPNVELLCSGDEFTEKKIRGAICNPIYTGIGPFKIGKPVVSDSDWISGAKRMIEEDGLEQFLINMLFVLRESFDSVSFFWEN